MRIPYFIYFGDGKFLPLLEEAMASHDSVNTQRARVLTDLTSKIPPELEACTTRVDTRDFIWFVREGNKGRNFDYKSAIVLAFLRIPQGNQFYLMDCDQGFRKNMDVELDKIPDNLMGMTVDGGRRDISISPVINKKYKIGNTILEMTSSLMLFPADSRHIGDLYVECVKNTVEPVHFLLEQRTWSVVWACLGAKGYMLPITMNWSRLYGEENMDVYVRHYHGNEKWTKK